MEKSFNECTLSFLEKQFGIFPGKSSTSLQAWLGADISIDADEKRDLTIFQELLNENVLHWNEQELSMHFIGPLFALTRFISENRRYNLFAQRLIANNLTTVSGQHIKLFGKPDGMVASGYREPETPFFSFNELKKEVETSGDPAAQVLAAMLVGQSLNVTTSNVMYGCYVIGQNWYFLTLVNKQYCISPAYSALTDDIFFVFKTLKSLKQIVSGLTN